VICYRKKIKPLFSLWHPVYVCHSDCCHFYLSLASAGEVSIFVYLWLSTDVCCHGNSTGKRLQILLLNSWSRSALVLKLCRSIFFWWQHYAMWRDLLHFIVSVCVCVQMCADWFNKESEAEQLNLASVLLYIFSINIFMYCRQSQSVVTCCPSDVSSIWVHSPDVSHQARSCSFYTWCQPSSSVL